MFSDQIAGAGNLPTPIDIFLSTPLSQSFRSDNISTSWLRQGVGTPMYAWNGMSDRLTVNLPGTRNRYSAMSLWIRPSIAAYKDWRTVFEAEGTGYLRRLAMKIQDGVFEIKAFGEDPEVIYHADFPNLFYLSPYFK